MSQLCTATSRTIVVGTKARYLLITAVLLLSSSLSIAGHRRPADGDTGVGVPSANEAKFLAVPDPVSAEHHMKVLTAEPHIAGSPADYRTALYVAQQFRNAGLETSIQEYRVWMNYPAEISVEAIPGKPGSYNAVAWLRPWLQLEELTTSLRMVAELPKKAGS